MKVYLFIILCLFNYVKSTELRRNLRGDEVTIPPQIVFDSLEFNSKYSVKFKRDDDLQPLSWSNVVIVVLFYDYILDTNLVGEHFNSWINDMDEGLDIVFVVDKDDKRSDEEILPFRDNAKPSIHLHRSSVQVKDGKAVKYKMIDALWFVEKKFGKNENKHFYLKLDPDTFLIPEKLMNFMSELFMATHPQPVDFGRSACFMTDMCFSQGGLYGFSRSGLLATVEYMKRNVKEMHTEIIHRKWNYNLMDHEDFVTSYIFRRATGYPVVSVPEIGENFNKFKPPFPYTPISIHLVKFRKEYKKLHETFYDHEGHVVEFKGLPKKN